MQVAVFSTKSYDREFLAAANAAHGHDLTFLEPRLTPQTARLADGFPAICAFVNDQLDAQVLLMLARNGTKLIALRSAGFNHVDLMAAEQLGFTVTRVPAYSPHAVAEHTVGLILALCRKLHKAYLRVREGNLSLEGLLGSDLHGRTAGVVGTGKIGTIVAQILAGFGCRVLAYDLARNPAIEAFGGRYVTTDELFAQSDLVTLHCPLVPETYHLINEEALARMKRGVMLINTSRGALVDTRAVVRALKSGKIGALGLDVYEEEADLFFEDLSNRVIQDDVFSRLLTFPNVIVTSHQAFFTRDALEAIARETLANITAYEQGTEPRGLLTPARAMAQAK
ncbi:MAG: 2-hydroxyacid dehydrogenase [Thermoguttaceae bacterium]|jgi:D-lactate dehydrogenase|nr:2-hydroxyacid dehydrogenase [Thermoguttaceae bacterium]